MEGQIALGVNQKYLNVCSEDNFSGLKRHEGESLMTKILFLGDLTL